jgi:hypothetical protein
MKKIVLAAILTLPWITLMFSCGQTHTTEMLVLGTIHSNHAKNAHYTYEDIVHILQSYQPDAICVEIRPQEFRKESYLKEMELAAIYGLANNLDVYPIDWWTGNEREKMEEYMKAEDYKIKKVIADSMLQASPIIQAFEEENGELKDYIHLKDYSWWNGKEFNDYTLEKYRISMGVFGDHCINLYYRTRNDSMMSRIAQAIENHPGERIIVLTGAEHKHYFDRELRNQNGVVVHELKDIQIESTGVMDKAVKDFLVWRDPGSYIPEITEGERFDRIYRHRLLRLLHGKDMDFHPYTVPNDNIDQGLAILDTLESQFAHLPDFAFEKGWIEFLRGHHQESIAFMDRVLEDSTSLHKPRKNFIIPMAMRTQAMCHDMMGQRQQAVMLYRKAKEKDLEFGPLDDWKSKVFYDRWIDKPYRHREEG